MVLSLKPEKGNRPIGTSMGLERNRPRRRLPRPPSNPLGISTPRLLRAGFIGSARILGRFIKSLISAHGFDGVIPQIASGERQLIRRATAPTNLPLMYTGLPLIPRHWYESPCHHLARMYPLGSDWLFHR